MVKCTLCTMVWFERVGFGVVCEVFVSLGRGGMRGRQGLFELVILGSTSELEFRRSEFGKSSIKVRSK